MVDEGVLRSQSSWRATEGIVYPVVSRRSGGLSLGVDLFPDRKVCSFDCPYCEVSLHGGTGTAFTLPALQVALDAFFSGQSIGPWAGMGIRDLCLAGSGEPTLSSSLEAALSVCARVRRSKAPDAALILITNSTGLADPAIASTLHRFIRTEGLSVWAKLDAGTEEWFRTMSRSSFHLSAIAADIESFSRGSPVSLQAMFCEVEGQDPGIGEAEAWADLVAGMLLHGCLVNEIQFYTQARPSHAGRTAALADAELSMLAAATRVRLEFRLRQDGREPPPIRVFGREGELGA